MSTLTIAYLTARKEPRIQWFVDSLANEMRATPLQCPVQIVVVDFWKGTRDLPLPADYKHVAPKPCVWQGPNRLTREDWFSAGNARNTALCYAHDGWIAYCDDLSVLMPGWLASVIEGMNFSGVTLGAYRKVNNLRVTNGNVDGFDNHPAGWDSRFLQVQEHRLPVPYDCVGDWLYGCSLMANVNEFLEINGWCEDLAGGLGFEDGLTGVVLKVIGTRFRYDPRMLTLESEEDHHTGEIFKKTDKGLSPNDKSHGALDRARAQRRFDNYFDLKEIRRTVLAGGEFPIPTEPRVDWWDQQPLGEMGTT